MVTLFLIQEARIYNGEKTAFSISGAGKVGHLHVNHTKWTKSERGRQIQYDIAYMWNLKYDTNELIYKTDSQT